MHYGPFWPTFALCCPLLPTSAHFGQLLNSFVNSQRQHWRYSWRLARRPFHFGHLGPIWIFLVHFGQLWSTVHFGPLWITFGPLWTTLENFGPLWTTFDPFFYSLRQHCPGRAPGDAWGGLGHTPAHGNGCGNPTKYPSVNSSYPLGSWVLWCQTHPGMYRIKHLHVF